MLKTLLTYLQGQHTGILSSELANTPVTSLPINHVQFNVQNPTVHSTAWSTKAILNTINVTKYVAPLADNQTFSVAAERSIVSSDN